MTDDGPVAKLEGAAYLDAESSETTEAEHRNSEGIEMQGLESNSPMSIIIEDARRHGNTSVHFRLLRKMHLEAMRSKVAEATRLALESDEAVDRIATAMWTYPIAKLH